MGGFVTSFANFQSFNLLKAKPVNSPPAVTAGDAAVQQAAAEAVARKNRARGYESTILGSMQTSRLKQTLGS